MHIPHSWAERERINPLSLERAIAVCTDCKDPQEVCRQLRERDGLYVRDQLLEEQEEVHTGKDPFGKSLQRVDLGKELRSYLCRNFVGYFIALQVGGNFHLCSQRTKSHYWQMGNCAMLVWRMRWGILACLYKSHMNCFS